MAAPQPPPDESYFPMQVGDRRISDVVFISPLGLVEKSTLTVTVQEKVEHQGKTCFRVRFVIGGSYAKDYTKLSRKDAEGVYSLDESRPGSEEVTDILLPLKVGDTQSIGVGERKMKVLVAGLESVTVGGKTYEQCYHLHMTPPDEGFQRDLWLAPGIGPVKTSTVFSNNGKMEITLRESAQGK